VIGRSRDASGARADRPDTEAKGDAALAGKGRGPAGASNPVSPELLRELLRLRVRTKRLVTDQLSGAYSSIFRGRGLSFSEVRGYQPGDDVRWIDWNVSARMNDAFVKVFVEERELTVMLVVDVSRSTAFGTRRAPKSQVAAEVAAMCAFSATNNDDQVGLLLATDVVERILPPKKGDRQVMRIVREIVGHVPEYQGTNLTVALETLVAVTKRRSVAFVVSDFFTTGFERALSLAASKHDVIPVMLVDPRDEELPDVGLASFQDLETGEEVLVDTSSAAVRAHYQSVMRGLRAENERLFRRHDLDYVVVRTDASPVGPIRALFQRRARRGRR
jgi:uncharacterized protein (DUF58 family)